MRTIGSVLDRNKGFGPGFDFVRIFLAMTILGWHSELVAPDRDFPLMEHFWMIEFSLLPMFFALSGFLITGSGMRLSLANFLINRGLRIVPALALEILFSALIIGPLFTSLPLGAYFSHSEFFSYFLNIVGYIHFTLPGVFTGHALNLVNISLWTIPYELICYVLMSVLIVTGWIRSPRIVGGVAFGLMAAAAVARSLPGMEVTFDGQGDGSMDKVIRFLATGEHATLLPSFLLGVFTYQIRGWLPYDRRLFIAAAAVLLAVGHFGSLDLLPNGCLRLFLLPLLSYVTVFVGVSPIPRLPLYSKGDYSYGVYLYHMPFQQILVGLIPGLTWMPLFVLSAILVTFVAMFSWHVVEKPVLRLRKSFSFVARQAASLDAQGGRPALMPTLGEVVAPPRLSSETD